MHYSLFSPPNLKYLLPPLGGEERKRESRGGEKKGDGNEWRGKGEKRKGRSIHLLL